MSIIRPEENTGTNFNLENYFKARQKTIDSIQKFVTQLKPGVTEADALNSLNQFLKEEGSLKLWHPSKLRFNSNTTKSFRDISDEKILQDEDIFFIDIGPVFYDHEGDYGETFVVGQNEKYNKIKEATRIIFDLTKTKWQSSELSGKELYEYATVESSKLGYRLNSNMYGHRLADFPHALHFKGDLGEIEFKPKTNMWVLEIHLIDDQNNIGAFFEDILF